MVFSRRNSGIAAAFLLCASSLLAQTVHRDTILILNTGTSRNIVMKGNLDAENTFTYPATWAFQPMVRMKLTNHSDTILIHPRIVIDNKKNWFDIESLRAECFDGALTDKEKALALWQFITKNRVHRYEPECCDEINDPVKLFGVYGYGMCYNTNYANTVVAQGLGVNSRSFSFRGGRHFASEIDFGGQYALIDGDLETFYLRSDNTTLGNYDDLVNDKNLIRRTHHFGKSEKYNYSNDYIASAIYAPFERVFYFGKFKNFHSLDVSLRPNESIEYSWSPGNLHHSFNTPDNAEANVIGNGRLIYESNFLVDNLQCLIDTVSGISTFKMDGQKPNLHAKTPGTPSTFLIRVSSPFVILGGTMKGNFVQQDADDRIAISFSKDSLNWQLAWESSRTGEFSDSVDLYQKIATLASPATYKYWLKFDISPNQTINSCGIDSLQIITDFQVSRSFLPALQLGNNTIDYRHENQGNMLTELLLEWQESSENIPPSTIMSPVFPENGSRIDKLTFTFSWNEASDPEDQIVDYEFILSDRMDLKFPLSPSFDVYTGLTNTGFKLNEFRIPFDGLLNSGTPYYWKVRAKDARGAWGDWSPVWSFIPSGPMPPDDGNAEIKNDSIRVTWSMSLNGITPSFYEVHGSRERSGFTPDASTLLDTTRSTHLTLPFDGANTNIFYRIIAVDANRIRSGPSAVIQAPYPYQYSPIDTLIPGLPYNTHVATVRAHTRDMLELFFNTYFTWSIDDEMETEILSKPDWMNYDSVSQNLSGKVDFLTAHSGIDSLKVKLKCLYDGASTTQAFAIPVQPNRKPELSAIDTFAIIDETFLQSISINDPDFPLGDYVSNVEIVAKPSWLNAAYSADKALIELWGKPLWTNMGDTLIVIRVFDSLGEPTLAKYGISVGGGEQKPLEVYPNPFQTSTKIRIKVKNNSLIKLDAFNLSGERMERLLEAQRPSGIFELLWSPSNQKKGIYLLRMLIEEKGTKRTIYSKKIIQIE